MKLHHKIRRIRCIKGYSQEVVADLLNLSVTGYGKIERGETDVTVSRLEQIANVLQVPIESILHFDESAILFSSSNRHSQSSFDIIDKNYSHKQHDELIKYLEENLIEIHNILIELTRRV